MEFGEYFIETYFWVTLTKIRDKQVSIRLSQNLV
jgi:hypothetical protein